VKNKLCEFSSVMALQDFVPHELKDQKTVFNALSRNK